MNKEELDSIQELIERKITLAEVTGGLNSSDKKFIALWNYTMQIQNNWNELKSFIEDRIYNIQPKGTGINYNCEYDSEEDYIRAMKEQARLNTLKEDLSKMQELADLKDERV